jgi:hypothetical protein
MCSALTAPVIFKKASSVRSDRPSDVNRDITDGQIAKKGAKFIVESFALFRLPCATTFPRYPLSHSSTGHQKGLLPLEHLEGFTILSL